MRRDADAMRCDAIRATKWTGLYTRATPWERIQNVHLTTRSHKLDRVTPAYIRNSHLAPLARSVLSADEILRTRTE